MIDRDRRRPARGVLSDPRFPTVVFAAVCTKGRRPWLANEAVHRGLREIWSHADRWLVGTYVILPDHLHLFAIPGEQPGSVDAWVTFWKSSFTRIIGDAEERRWQSGSYHHRLRSYESLIAKREYMEQNPVRAGLVKHPHEWPFRGEVHEWSVLW